MKRKRNINLRIQENDVAFVFREGGHVDVSFPEIGNDSVPDHIMAALAISYAITDPQTLDTLRSRFAHQQLLGGLKKACNDQ